ncbi:transposase [Streptomyces sp. NPDC050423]|uniref:IS701 family transposase n=1 Tax=Streptomyces sp. NPDC050423 TaxID=3155402 RepID=UPI003445BFCD
MLPDPAVPASLLAVLVFLRGCFTVPTFTTFAALVTGLIAQTGRGTVTGMLTGVGLTRTWSHDRAHAFFSRARWNPDLLGISLSHLIVRQLLPADAVLTLVVDDTLFKRRGKKVFGAAWQHDGAATGPRGVGRGTCFVVLGLVVDLPFLARPVCLPVMARLWRPKQEQSKVDIAASMIRFLAACHHGRRIHVVADAAYHGKALRGLPATCTFTTRLPATCTFTTRLPSSSVLFALAPPRTGKRGRPALKGVRLGTPAQLAATADFAPVQVTRYQRTDTVHLAEVTCLWYGSFHTRTVRVILLWDDTTDTGYDLALVTTDLTSSAAELITRYAKRWSIEVTFAEARHLLGAGQAHNRTRAAVERTVPFGLYCYTITVAWYALHGHQPGDVTERRERAPWYTTKTDPSLSDMVAKLRRVIIAARFMPTRPGQPTEQEIRTVQQAWAAASTNAAA